MNITIDQAMALNALVKHGTFKKAAESLGKGHAAVMYLVKNLEEATGLRLLDRKGYRNQLTEEGRLVHSYCLKLLETKNEMELICEKLKGGFEAQIRLVYDGVINFDSISEVLVKVKRSDIPTQIKVSAAYLDEVEKRYNEENADMMLTILPQKKNISPSIPLKPIQMFLVAKKDHHLTKSKKVISTIDLKSEVYISVRGSTVGVGLSTDELDVSSMILVNDFYSKKTAILNGLGFGWLPEYIMRDELKTGDLKVINTNIENQHKFIPRVYHKDEKFLGKGAKALLESFAVF